MFVSIVLLITHAASLIHNVTTQLNLPLNKSNTKTTAAMLNKSLYDKTEAMNGWFVSSGDINCPKRIEKGKTH